MSYAVKTSSIVAVTLHEVLDKRDYVCDPVYKTWFGLGKRKATGWFYKRDAAYLWILGEEASRLNYEDACALEEARTEVRAHLPSGKHAVLAVVPLKDAENLLRWVAASVSTGHPRVIEGEDILAALGND